MQIELAKKRLCVLASKGRSSWMAKVGRTHRLRPQQSIQRISKMLQDLISAAFNEATKKVDR